MTGEAELFNTKQNVFKRQVGPKPFFDYFSPDLPYSCKTRIHGRGFERESESNGRNGASQKQILIKRKAHFNINQLQHDFNVFHVGWPHSQPVRISRDSSWIPLTFFFSVIQESYCPPLFHCERFRHFPNYCFAFFLLFIYFFSKLLSSNFFACELCEEQK